MAFATLFVGAIVGAIEGHMGTHRKLYMFEHRGGFKYKKAVPSDLHSIIGRKAWTKYLGAIARPKAELEARALSLDHDRLIQALRALNPAELGKIAAAGGLKGYVATTKNAEDAAAFIEAGAGRYEPDPNAPEDQYEREAVAIFRARHEVAQLDGEAAAGKNVLAKLDPKNRTLSSLGALIDTWVRVANPRSARSIGKMKLYVGRFIATVGDLTPAEVTADHAAGFRDLLEKRTDIASVTADKHLHALHTLFNVARSERIVDRNVFHGVKIHKAGKFADGVKKKALQPAQVRAIFSKLPGESEDFQWIVRLLAYHGARSGEICQLRREDVTEQFGVPVLRIHDTFGSLKNKASMRDIPIHPACMGIVAYAKAAAGPWLFSLQPKTGERSGKFQRYASTWLRSKVGIKDPALTMHSLRHTWRTLAREKDMPEPVSRAIMGHALGTDDHAGYGGVPSLKVRAKWIRKINPLG